MKHYTFVDFATQLYLAVVALIIVFFHNGTVPHWRWLLGAHVAAMVVVHCLIWIHAQAQPGRALNFFRHFYPVLLYTAFFCETAQLNRMFYTDYLDPMVIRWDQALFGCQPSVLFMQKLPYLVFSELFYLSYFSYYIMIVGVGIALFVRDRTQFFHYVSVVSFVFYLCYLTYIFMPVIGPMVFFHDVDGYSLPSDIQQLASTDIYPPAIKAGPFYHVMAWIYRVFESPGAAFPSSHVAIAACTVFFSFRYLRTIRYLHLLVAILLCLSTIYCRYHYATDVLAGLLTAVILIPIANLLYSRFPGSNPAPDS